jgi:two-component system LytT family response regulator
VLISAAWVVPALLAALAAYLQARMGWRERVDLKALLWEGGDWLLYGALTPLVFLLARRLPLRRGQLARNIPIHFVGALLLCLLWAGLGLIYRHLLGLEPMGPTPLRSIEGWALITLPFGVAVYFAVLGVEHATVYYAEAREREVHAARLSSQLAEARLGALRSQLNPHFLFNSLNAITVLVRDRDIDTASRMLEQLGDVLRQALATDRTPEIPLAEEIGFLERYLAIEQVRFSDRLRATFEVDPEAMGAAVPSFVLQPLVENALRHGLAKRTEGGTLVIAARREGDELVLEVGNDGPGLGTPQTGERPGLGLSNTRERLATMYGDRGRLMLANRATGGVIATVRLPYREFSALPPGSSMADVRALIVDDEPLARRGVRQLLAAHPDILVVGECRNGREALRAFDSLSPDLVFLDVQMPGLDGFGVLRERGGRRMPFLVFVTAFDEFAVRAFEAQALDYLVKPLSQARFDATIRRVRERMRLVDAGGLAAHLANLLAADAGRRAGGMPAPPAGDGRRIAVPTATGRLFLDPTEIDWVEARDYYAGIHAGGQRHLVRESLVSLEKRLDPSEFVRVHRSALVRIDRVREIRSAEGDSVAILADGTAVPVSRRRRARLAASLRISPD